MSEKKSQNGRVAVNVAKVHKSTRTSDGERRTGPRCYTTEELNAIHEIYLHTNGNHSETARLVDCSANAICAFAEKYGWTADLVKVREQSAKISIKSAAMARSEHIRVLDDYLKKQTDYLKSNTYQLHDKMSPGFDIKGFCQGIERRHALTDEGSAGKLTLPQLLYLIATQFGSERLQTALVQMKSEDGNGSGNGNRIDYIPGSSDDLGLAGPPGRRHSSDSVRAEAP